MNKKEIYERTKLELTFFSEGTDILNDSDAHDSEDNLTKAIRSSKPFPYMNGGRESLY